jgi:hypothetical protein
MTASLPVCLGEHGAVSPDQSRDFGLPHSNGEHLWLSYLLITSTVVLSDYGYS